MKPGAGAVRRRAARDLGSGRSELNIAAAGHLIRNATARAQAARAFAAAGRRHGTGSFAPARFGAIYARREIDMSDAAPKPWPTELRLNKDRNALTAVFDNAESFELSAEYLRVKSPSAEVQGHSPDERKTVAGKKNVAILEVKPVGNYAVRLVFDDMHSTGIYSWDYLLDLGRNREAYWRDYLDDLAGKGLQR
jgi:DUF971 family protein